MADEENDLPGVRILLHRVILLADVFLNLPFGLQFKNSRGCPGLRVRFRIVNRVPVLERVMNHAAHAFDDVQRIRMRQAHRVEPGLVIETDRVNDQRVAFKFADRVPHVRRFQIARMSSPIHEDLPHQGLVLVNDHDAVARLNNLPGKRLKHGARNAGRNASLGRVHAHVRIVVRIVVNTLPEERFCPGLKGRVFVWKDGSVIFVDKPDA